MAEEIGDTFLMELKSPERKQQINGMKKLQEFCDTTKDLQIIISTFNSCYLYLINFYFDRFENTREQAILTINSFMKSLPVNDFYLQNVVVAMADRIGKPETLENSEEIRLLFVNQLDDLIEKYAKTDENDYLAQIYHETIDILYKALKDSYPAIQRAACTCIVKLSKATNVFYKRAEHLALPLFAILSHKHSQSRRAAVEACYILVLYIDHKSDMLVRIFQETTPLLMDPMPLVRQQCGIMGCLMLMEFRDRYSFFDRLIPLVLCCLKDDSAEIRQSILISWKECGKQYYNENEEELRKIEIGEKISPNYPKWEVRPTLGCRALVQRSLRLIHAIIREASDWKENVRMHSLKLLYQFVLHAEAAMTAKFFEIYLDLAKACSDSEPLVAKEAMKVADLMGRLLSYPEWKEHAIEGLQKNHRLGHIRCFYHLFAATPEFTTDDLIRISEILLEREFSQNLNVDFQTYVLRLVEELWRKNMSRPAGDDEGLLIVNAPNTLDKNLYATTVRVMAIAVSLHHNDIQKHGQEILERISQDTGNPLSALHAKYLSWVLEKIDDLDASLDSGSEPIHLLCGIIHNCLFRPASMKALKRNIRTVWDTAGDEVKINVFSAISIAMLKWNETMDLPPEESEEELRQFITEIVEEHILWRVGATAESLRSLATATLCAMTQGAMPMATKILPSMVKYFTNLLEDHSVSTRIYAVKCLLNFGEVEVEQLRNVAYAVIQRLDDPHGGIRELAAMVIPELQTINVNDFDQDTWNSFIKKAATTLFLYFDGPEVKLREAIKKSLIKLGKKYPDLFEEPLNCALAITCRKEELEQIQSAVYPK